VTSFQVKQLAPAWLAASETSGPKDCSIALAQTVFIEQYPEGVRIVGCDGYCLIRTFAFSLEGDGLDQEPKLGELPVRTAIAHDPDGRAKGLLKWLYAKATGDKDNADLYEVRLGFRDGVQNENQLMGMESKEVTLDFPDHERVTLSAHEMIYPDWRTLETSFVPEAASTIALSPGNVAAITRAAKWCPGPIRWHFGGNERVALFDVGNGDPVSMRGLVTPVRVFD
jgi:hypothetical protein